MSYPPAAEKFFSWNGEIQAVGNGVNFNPLSDGLLYGIGCFETMALRKGRIRFRDEHRRRLARAVKGMGFSCEFSWERFEEAIAALVEKNSCPDGVARLSLHAEGAGVSWLMRVFPGGKFAGLKSLRVGFSRIPHPGASPLSRWKHNNYALNLLAYRQGLEDGYDEVVLCRGEDALEGALSTLWILLDGELRTPPLADGVLAGVVRERLLSLGRVRDISIREGRISRDDLRKAEGIFLSNAAMLLKPVSEWEGRERRAPVGICDEINRALEGR